MNKQRLHVTANTGENIIIKLHYIGLHYTCHTHQIKHLDGTIKYYSIALFKHNVIHDLRVITLSALHVHDNMKYVTMLKISLYSKN